MKFIKLESRGGNYLVVADNIAWLRTAENGQTSVGIVGGQPLLVVGSIEEVAEKILSAAGTEPESPSLEAPAAAPAAQPVAAAQAPSVMAIQPATPTREAPRPGKATKIATPIRSAPPTGFTLKSGTQRLMGLME